MSSATTTPSADIPVTDGHGRALAWLRSGPKRLLIGGEWVLAASGKTFKTIGLATETVLAAVAEADGPDVDAAVVAARRACTRGTGLVFRPISAHNCC
ncbi:hypothetical protein LP414_07870 [Polaromonas sp. P1(28)-13]|nr:hypothetical protein LP414_07870 [Polaromonas sp. P1(28)-13]